MSDATDERRARVLMSDTGCPYHWNDLTETMRNVWLNKARAIRKSDEAAGLVLVPPKPDAPICGMKEPGHERPMTPRERRIMDGALRRSAKVIPDPRDAEDETLLQEASQAIESRLAGWHDPAILGLITSLCAALATARDEALEEAAQAIELPMTPMTIMDMETLEAAAATIRALKTKGAGDE